MTHQIAKLMLEWGDRRPKRTEVVKAALSLGMQLSEIEQYFDWLDMVEPQGDDQAFDGDRNAHKT